MVSQHSAKRRSGGRKPREEEMQLPPEEEEKRRLRRLRNKEAAARCRKRRVDQMSELDNQVKELSQQQNAIELELEQLNQEKEHLEFVLRTHEAVCRANIGVGTIKRCSSTDSTEYLRAIVEQRSPTSSMINGVTHHNLCRPQTLTLAARAASAALEPLNASFESATTTTAGGVGATPSCTGILIVPIQTPSKMTDYDPLNAPTGFTPVASSGASNFLAPFLYATTTSASETLETPVLGDIPAHSVSERGAATNAATH